MTVDAISSEAKKHLKLITDGQDLALLEAVDLDTLCRYCESYARWSAAEKQITEHGVLVKGQSGYPGENPYIAVAHRYSGMCSRMENGVRGILKELRTVSEVIQEDVEPDEGDDIDTIIAKGLGGSQTRRKTRT